MDVWLVIFERGDFDGYETFVDGAFSTERKAVDYVESQSKEFIWDDVGRTYRLKYFSEELEPLQDYERAVTLHPSRERGDDRWGYPTDDPCVEDYRIERVPVD